VGTVLYFGRNGGLVVIQLPFFFITIFGTLRGGPIQCGVPFSRDQSLVFIYWFGLCSDLIRYR